MTRAIEHQHRDRGSVDALGLGEPANIVGQRGTRPCDFTSVAFEN